MSGAANRRGAASVGFLADLPPIEAASICYLRSWCDSRSSQIDVARDLACALGEAAGAQATGTLGELCRMCIENGRRPLMRHGLQCRCLGADEACFATLIAAGSEGAREDAMMLASLIVRVEMAPLLASLAIDFGMALRRVCLQGTRPQEHPTPAVPGLLH